MKKNKKDIENGGSGHSSKRGLGEILENVYVEPVDECSLVKERWVSNGHDCWGNSEGYTEKYVWTGKESLTCFDGWYVIHDGKSAVDVVSESVLGLRVLREANERKEKENMRRTGFRTEAEYVAYLKGREDMKRESEKEGKPDSDPEPKIEDFYDVNDPRGCSSSEFYYYEKALNEWKRRRGG